MIRIDTRKKFQKRRVLIKQHSPNCATLNMGDTQIIANISYFIGPPHQNRKNEGDIRIVIDIDPKLRKTYPRNFVSLCQTRIRNTIRETQSIQMESLCILESRAVWYLNVDLRVLADDGNLVSGFFIATSHILSTCRLPEVSTVGDTWVVHSLQDRLPVPLSIKQLPTCSSFAIFINKKTTNPTKSTTSAQFEDDPEEEETMPSIPTLSDAYDVEYSTSKLEFVADPILSEETTADGSLVIIRDVANDIHRIEFAGPPLHIDQLSSIIEIDSEK